MIEIVSHCWAADLPQYAAFLKYQLSSLILYRPTVSIRMTVCYCPEDVATADVLSSFLIHTNDVLDLQPLPLSKEELGRRAIGRNIVAKRTEADLVWFADVDMVFREGCLDELWSLWLDDRGVREYGMYWVTELQIHRTHELGDIAAQAADSKQLVDVNPDEFKLKRYNRGIGGVQIVPQRICHEMGYLDRHAKYQECRTDGRPFGDFREDVAYRYSVQDRWPLRAIILPELYRMRHSQTTYH